MIIFVRHLSEFKMKTKILHVIKIDISEFKQLYKNELLINIISRKKN